MENHTNLVSNKFMIKNFALSFLLIIVCNCAYAEVTAISPNQHPNLFFNQQEIDALRQAVLVDGSPQYAVNTFNNIKNTGPAAKPGNINSLPWPENCIL